MAQIRPGSAQDGWRTGEVRRRRGLFVGARPGLEFFVDLARGIWCPLLLFANLLTAVVVTLAFSQVVG